MHDRAMVPVIRVLPFNRSETGGFPALAGHEDGIYSRGFPKGTGEPLAR